MNIKVIGSIVRWAVLLSSAAAAFAGDASFVEAISKLKDAISSGNTPTIISSVLAVATLGWSIWDKVKTQKKENEAEAKIKSLSTTVSAQAAAIAKTNKNA